MSQSSDIVISIPLDDGRTIIASPGPQGGWGYIFADGGRDIVLKAPDGDLDTSGHVESTDVLVDVEGHAMALRLPTAGDAAALRRALAMGAISATLVAAGAIGATLANQPPATTAADKPAIEAPAQPGSGHTFSQSGPRRE